MACGKKSANAPTEEFILESPAPVDVAAKLSAIYRELSLKVLSYPNLKSMNFLTNSAMNPITLNRLYLVAIVLDE